MTSRSTASLLALLLAVGAPDSALAAAPSRAVSVADFSVRAPGARAAESAWLGPAVAELLQAKMQLFRGARVLERTRLAPSEAAPAGGEPRPDKLSSPALPDTPAALLIFGSVEIAPGGGDPATIKVRARAVETETTAVVSESAFSGTADLAGLLQVAASLAQHLADALGFTYTPEQLAYAEPAGLDALKLYLEADAHAAAGRHRLAIDTYQRALDGNAGKYFPAAHRSQGAAYRAFAGSLSAEQARRTREEYLAKFRADALAASGALFDLGLAYEANGLWREAIGAYDDYLGAVGKEGETVRWTFSAAKHTGIQGAAVPFPAASDGDRIHIVVQGTPGKPGFWWVTLDAASGAVVGSVPLLETLTLPPAGAAQVRLLAADRGGVHLSGHRLLGVDADGDIHGNTWFGDPWVAALDSSGRLLWKVPVGSTEQHVSDAQRFNEHLLVVIASRHGPSEGLLLDAASGRTLDRFPLGKGAYDLAAGRFVPPYFDPKATGGGSRWAPGVRYPTGRPGITFSVSEGAGPHEGDRRPGGVSFYEGDRHVLSLPGMQPVFKNPPLEGDDLPLVVYDGVWKYRQVFPRTWSVSKDYMTAPPTEELTGVPGLTLFGWGAYSRLFKDGKQVLRLPRSGIEERPFAAPQQGWIVLERADGVSAINPANFQPLELYGGARLQRSFLGQDEEYLLFSVTNDPARGGVDPLYGTATTEPGTVLNLVSKKSGAIVAKHFLRDLNHLSLIEHDPVIVANNAVTRIRLIFQGHVVVGSPAEAYLRRAACLTEAGDTAAAEDALAHFEAAATGDPRSTVLRMSMAARRGDGAEAGRLGLRAMASGGLSGTEFQACLAAVRTVRPEVRDAVASKVKSRLLLRSMAGPGMLVATLEGRGENTLHILIDTLRKTSTIVPTPEYAAGSSNLRYDGGRVLGLLDVESHSVEHVAAEMVGWGGGEIDGRHQVLGVDLPTGVRTHGPAFPFTDGAWLPGPPLRIAGRQSRRGSVILLDPGDLSEIGRLDVGGHRAPPLFSGEVLVLGGGVATRFGKDTGSGSFLVLDGSEGRIIDTLGVDFDKEKVAAVAADRDRLVVGITSVPAGSVRLESFALSPRGRTWTWRGAGRLAGNIVFEDDHLDFPLEESPASSLPTQQGAGISIVRASLDLATGEQRPTTPLAPNPWTAAAFGRSTRARIFPGLATWRLERDAYGSSEDVYRVFAPDLVPLRVSDAGGTEGCQVVVDDRETTYQPDFLFTSGKDHVIPVIACGDTVYESIGGGVILVKDFAAGIGLERVIKDQRIGLWR